MFVVPGSSSLLDVVELLRSRRGTRDCNPIVTIINYDGTIVCTERMTGILSKEDVRSMCNKRVYSVAVNGSTADIRMA